jgi:hypothetical protein
MIRITEKVSLDRPQKEDAMGKNLVCWDWTCWQKDRALSNVLPRVLVLSLELSNKGIVPIAVSVWEQIWLRRYPY